MAVALRARAMIRARLLRLRLLCRGAFAALLALNIGAVRLDGGAVSSDGFNVAALASRVSIPLVPNTAAAWAQRDRDLQAAGAYIDSISVQDYFHLGNIRNILERLEEIKERVTSFGAARDSLHRLQIRQILRKVKEQSETLRVLAGQWEAEGEVDDGGDELPTQRDSICSRISKCSMDSDIGELLHLFCDCLDNVRKAVNAGEDEEPMAYSVVGLFNALAKEPEYRQGHLGSEIERVLGEERRWVAKHLAPRPARTGDGLHSPEGTKAVLPSWAMRAWETRIFEDPHVDIAALPCKALTQAHELLASVTVDDDLTLGSVLTRIQRLDLCRYGLAPFISSSDAAVRERIRDVFHEIKARMIALSALAARKSAAGEVDGSSELLPSQRDNICTKLDAFVLEEDFREDVRKICEILDKVHVSANVDQLEKDIGGFELLGRMVALRGRPGYSDTLVANELGPLLAEQFGSLY